MKKLLAILLIATISCLVVEETPDDVVLEGFLKNIVKGVGKGVKVVGKGVKEVGKGVGKGVKEVGKGVKEVGKGIKGLGQKIDQFLKGASKVIKASVKYLKDHGILDKVLNILVEVGKMAATTLCTNYGGPVAGEICNTAIDFIADKVIKK